MYSTVYKTKIVSSYPTFVFSWCHYIKNSNILKEDLSTIYSDECAWVSYLQKDQKCEACVIMRTLNLEWICRTVICFITQRHWAVRCCLSSLVLANGVVHWISLSSELHLSAHFLHCTYITRTEADLFLNGASVNLTCCSCIKWRVFVRQLLLEAYSKVDSARQCCRSAVSCVLAL